MDEAGSQGAVEGGGTAPAEGAPLDPREVRIRRGRAIVALERIRLRRSGYGRLAVIFASLVAVGFAVSALIVRQADGPGAPLEGMIGTAARVLVWLAGVPLALAAADDRRAMSRRDGVEALAGGRGVDDFALDAARVVAAMGEGAAVIGAPLVALALITAAVAGSARLALARLGLAALAALFAVVAGVTLGGLGALCGRIARGRARWLFAAALLLPWLLADLAGRSAWSIPGALDAAIDLVLRGGGARA